MREVDPIAVVPPHDVVVLQPYGNLAYATAPVFDEQLPKVEATSRGSVVIFRLRGVDELGLSLVAVLERYLRDLEQQGSTLWLVVAGDRIRNQLAAGGLLDRLGPDRVYASSEWIGEAVHRAHRDALEWVRRQE